MQMMWTPFVNQSAPHESARYQNDNCRRSFPFRDVLIFYISQESQNDCLHVDFECFKEALWPTLRQKFMNFWNFFTLPGDKHDEKISNCSSTPKLSWSKLTTLLESHDFLSFLTTRPPISWFFRNIILKWNVSLFNKNGNVYCWWIVSDSPHVNFLNRKLQETWRRFSETLVGHVSGVRNDCFLQNICSEKQILPRILFCLRKAKSF